MTLSISYLSTVVEGQKVGITLELNSDVLVNEFNVTLENMDATATGEVSCSTGSITH